MSKQFINELRFMFLEQIATQTPEAAAALFELRDARQWQDKYKVSADWLETFLRAALEEGQRRYDWIATRLQVFDNVKAARGRLADWIGVRYAPAWLAFRGDWTDGGAGMLVSASTTAWRQTITTYKANHEMLRLAEKAAAGRITYLDLTEDKRNAVRACGWLVSWLFSHPHVSYEQIRETAGVKHWQIVERTAKAFAKTTGLKIEPRRGRRPPQRTHLRKSKKKS